MKRFRNRRAAGIELAGRLARYADRDDVIVLGLARGGVPVGYEIARALHLPLDVFVVRKLGAPAQEEYAVGAIATGGVRVLNLEAIQALAIPADVIERLTLREQPELERREKMYRGTRPPPDLKGKTVIVVDDGLATGATMHAAIAAIRKQGPEAIIAAAPVIAPETCRYLRTTTDGCEFLHAPDPFYGVGMWYVDFAPTSDREVQTLLEAARRNAASPVRELASEH